MAQITETQKSKLEPNPKAKLSPETTEDRKVEKKPAETKVKKTKKKSKSDDPSGSQFLELGSGYRIAHKPGSGYSTFYRVVAEKGHFTEIASSLESGKVNVNDPATANKLLDRMLVPVDKLEEYCRTDASWREHADKKTENLTAKAKDGDGQAKGILANNARCSAGAWSGNIAEMISTCVGYYNHLLDGATGLPKRRSRKKKDAGKPNKNVLKFQEAEIVFRRFPQGKTGDKSFVMMFPEKFIDVVKTAILVGRGINEDQPKLNHGKQNRQAVPAKA